MTVHIPGMRCNGPLSHRKIKELAQWKSFFSFFYASFEFCVPSFKNSDLESIQYMLEKTVFRVSMVFFYSLDSYSDSKVIS